MNVEAERRWHAAQDTGMASPLAQSTVPSVSLSWGNDACSREQRNNRRHDYMAAGAVVGQRKIEELQSLIQEKIRSRVGVRMRVPACMRVRVCVRRSEDEVAGRDKSRAARVRKTK